MNVFSTIFSTQLKATCNANELRTRVSFINVVLICKLFRVNARTVSTSFGGDQRRVNKKNKRNNKKIAYDNQQFEQTRRRHIFVLFFKMKGATRIAREKES